MYELSCTQKYKRYKSLSGPTPLKIFLFPPWTYKKLYIYIVIDRQICFVLSELISVDRQ